MMPDLQRVLRAAWEMHSARHSPALHVGDRWGKTVGEIDWWSELQDALS